MYAFGGAMFIAGALFMGIVCAAATGQEAGLILIMSVAMVMIVAIAYAWAGEIIGHGE